MKIFSVINQKGGIGKTMLATNIAYIYSSMCYKTLIIDLDHQANTSSMYKPDNATILLENRITKKDDLLSDCIYKATVNDLEIDNLYIIPASRNLAEKTNELAAKMYKETFLKRKLDKLNKKFDICIIDCMTTASIFSINAIYASDYFIAPFDYARYALEGLGALIETISEVKEKKKVKYFFVSNKFDSRTKVTNSFIENELSVFKQHICKTVIHKAEIINQADISSMPVTIFAKKSKSANQISKLATEILNDSIKC